MRRFLAAVALATMFAASATAPSAPAATVLRARTLPQAASCSGVWVVVDFGSLSGGISTRCATSYGTGAAALRSAGFSPTITDGFVYKISGKPSKPDINKAYWSYWHATPKADGSYGGWTYSNLGANGYKPTSGNAEGWRYQSLSDGKVPPGAAPPAATQDEPTPSTTPSKPKPKPTKKASPTKKPAASAKPGSTSARPSATAKPSKTTASSTPSASTEPGTTATPTVTAQSSDTGTSVPATAGVPITVAAPVDDSGSGSPAGLITTLGIVLAGAAGLGLWWWKGRKP
ncbi:MAG: hypothetical protein QM619_13375 [Micropruina sp.]|uniref:hypothetical protein n=1 Tax=Micropruina sp. TaxID=2737536 RepID=UPI0039E43E6D